MKSPVLKYQADEALDAGYNKVAAPLLARISRLSRAGELQAALKELDTEAAQLAKDGQLMPVDDAYLLKAQSLVRDMLIAAGALIAYHALGIQESGQAIAIMAVTGQVFAQLTKQIPADLANPNSLIMFRQSLDALGVDWTIPEALDFATGYVDSQAWVARMDTWGEGYADVTRETILTGIQNGWGPLQIAGKVRQVAENLPKSAAENLMRTLQLTSYRDASLAMESLNSGFIVEKVRIATLDQKTCLSCIALHGTILQVGERVDDHYQGRCSSWYRTYGGALFPDFMQADSLPGKRNFVKWQDGESWFASLSPERQAQQASFKASPAKLAAYQAGNPLSTFVGEHYDDVFGRQVVENSLKAALGEVMAQEFYK